MAFDKAGILEAGKLQAAEALLYTPTAAHTGTIRIIIANDDSGTGYDYHFFVRKAGDATSYRITGNGANLALKSSLALPDADGNYVIGPGDSVRGYAATADKIHFSIQGGESPTT